LKNQEELCGKVLFAIKATANVLYILTLSEVGVLRECSRFGRGESGEWLYLEALSLGEGLAG
jgi:hypothetical protein